MTKCLIKRFRNIVFFLLKYLIISDKKLVKILVNIYSFHSFSDFIRFKKLYAYKTND